MKVVFKESDKVLFQSSYLPPAICFEWSKINHIILKNDKYLLKDSGVDISKNAMIIEVQKALF